MFFRMLPMCFSRNSFVRQTAIPCLDLPLLRRHFAACGSSESRPRAGMPVKRLHRQTISFVILPSHLANLRCELSNTQKQKAPLAERLSHFTPCRARAKPARAQTSQRVIHVELDRMRGHLEAFDFGHLQLDVAVDEVVVEHAAVLQEAAVLVEVF